MDRLLATDRPTRRAVGLVGVVLADDPGSTGDPGPTALRARLHERLARTGVLGGSARLAAFGEHMRRAYAARIGDDPSTPRTPEDLARAARERAESGVRRAGERVPAWIDARLTVTRRAARGAVERFAAEQWALMRSTAVWLSVRNPALESRLESIVREADGRASSAGGVVEQIMLGESSMMRLWKAVLEAELVS